jgi:hypothetical protein
VTLTLQPTAEPGVKVLPLEGYKECINLLGSFDDETLEMARKLHKDLHPGQAFLKVMQLPIRDKLCTFCGSFFRASRGGTPTVRRVLSFQISSPDCSPLDWRRLL